ncbi:MAG TPA: GNAT family N-acetyltransferase [Albitalea sp.]|uniref:GNAT family N-acetyltransferase n=1 Tax=Piscinibacter sp. TaxID=1903157 RepID=UPI002ED5279F
MDIPASAPLFEVDGLRALELRRDDLPALQRFFDANPEYFLAVSGQPPRPDEARQEFEDRPPAGMPYTAQSMLRFLDASDELAGIASITSDLFASRVWHIGLFVVATSLHGSGVAGSIYEALEGWIRGQGAQWIRLGAVIGNVRAERFWHKVGYTEVRQRSGVEMGTKVNTLRVMVKPLAGGNIASYLDLVERDRP